jgi:putative ABC transport system permease protein
MNPFPVVFSLLHRHRVTLIFFVALITFAVALGIAITTQERAVRQGSARAADKFDLVVGAPGSPFDLVLASVYARPTAMGLVSPEDLARLMAEEQAEFVAPIAFGDSVDGFPLMGTTGQFVTHLSGAIAEGRMFERPFEVLLGANVPLELGALAHAAHDSLDSAEMLHEQALTIVGRMARTNSAWDNVVVAPVENVWLAHGLPGGHAPVPGEAVTESRIGPPFDTAFLPGVPAVVVKPANVPAAYGLRNQWRTNTTQAIFPAEILVQLYAVLGDARAIMSFLALATQVLVVAAILSGVMVILQLFRVRFAVLRALGASGLFVFLVAWTYVALLIAVGAALGLLLGVGASFAVSAYLEMRSGIAMPVSLSWQDVQFVLALVVVGAAMAVLPAVGVYRQPVVEGLR